jgi:D-tyrosyl-tRNA(Tyr) deacylase
MRAVIQRVKKASVTVDGKKVSEIGPGLLTFLGIFKSDLENPHLTKLITKICELRIFEDAEGKMNQSLLDTKGSHLIVSQFTLAADTESGRRPSFINAQNPVEAKVLYERAIEMSKSLGVRTVGGVFQADMKVELLNDGPVTFVLDA